MARSLKVAPQYIEKVKLTNMRLGFPRQSDLADELGLSRSTISSFFNGKPINFINFVEICERLELDWKEISDFPQNEDKLDLKNLLSHGSDYWNRWRENNPDILIQLKGYDLSRMDLSCYNLSHTNLAQTDLSHANLSQADLTFANLVEANLSNANLVDTNLRTVQALATNFDNTNLTGSCIEDWHINDETQFDNIICDYIFLKSKIQHGRRIYTERRPSDLSRIFALGDFSRLIRRAHETVDLIFREGIDWSAFSQSFQSLQIKSDVGELSIQAIERKHDNSFVIRVAVPSNADKAKIEREFFEQYQPLLELKKEQLSFYQEQLKLRRDENKRLINIVESMAANKSIETNYGTVTHVSVNMSDSSINMSQNQTLVEVAKEIQNLLEQLEETHPISSTTEQMVVATEAIRQIESNPSLKQRAINAAKGNLLELIKQNPIGAFVAGAIEGWTDSSK